MIVVNIMMNILNMILPVFIFNRIKDEKGIKNYVLFFISYLISIIIINFSYKNIIFAYLICSIVFYAFKKFKKEVFLIMINTILSISFLTAIPMLFVGYGNVYIIINQIIIITMFIASYKAPLNNVYKKLIPNWNRNKNNKIKSVTLRNTTLISLYLMITLINIFLNQYFFTIYQKLV